jgi:hypothetical protein
MFVFGESVYADTYMYTHLKLHMHKYVACIGTYISLVVACICERHVCMSVHVCVCVSVYTYVTYIHAYMHIYMPIIT